MMMIGRDGGRRYYFATFTLHIAAFRQEVLGQDKVYAVSLRSHTAGP